MDVRIMIVFSLLLQYPLPLYTVIPGLSGIPYHLLMIADDAWLAGRELALLISNKGNKIN